MIRDGEEPLIVVVGPSKCGKTTLGFWLVWDFWRKHRLTFIVFDPFKRKHRWPRNCRVFDNLATFKHVVKSTRGHGVAWDESTTTLNKNDPEDIGFFTNIRHDHRALIVFGHDYTIITPTMRANLSEAYVFRQSQDRPSKWAGLFADDALMQTATLEHREFIHKEAFKPIVRRKLTASEVEELKRA